MKIRISPILVWFTIPVATFLFIGEILDSISNVKDYFSFRLSMISTILLVFTFIAYKVRLLRFLVIKITWYKKIDGLFIGLLFTAWIPHIISLFDNSTDDRSTLVEHVDCIDEFQEVNQDVIKILILPFVDTNQKCNDRNIRSEVELKKSIQRLAEGKGLPVSIKVTDCEELACEDSVFEDDDLNQFSEFEKERIDPYDIGMLYNADLVIHGYQKRIRNDTLRSDYEISVIAGEFFEQELLELGRQSILKVSQRRNLNLIKKFYNYRGESLTHEPMTDIVFSQVPKIFFGNSKINGEGGFYGLEFGEPNIVERSIVGLLVRKLLDNDRIASLSKIVNEYYNHNPDNAIFVSDILISAIIRNIDSEMRVGTVNSTFELLNKYEKIEVEYQPFLDLHFKMFKARLIFSESSQTEQINYLESLIKLDKPNQLDKLSFIFCTLYAVNYNFTHSIDTSPFNLYIARCVEFLRQEFNLNEYPAFTKVYSKQLVPCETNDWRSEITRSRLFRLELFISCITENPNEIEKLLNFYIQ